MILTLKRTNILDIKLAIQLVILDFQAAIKNPEAREERKETARRSIENRWLPLLENIKEQFEKQDEGSQALDFEKIPGGEDVMMLDDEAKIIQYCVNKSTWESIKDIQVLLTLMLQKNYRNNHRNTLPKI